MYYFIRIILGAGSHNIRRPNKFAGIESALYVQHIVVYTYMLLCTIYICIYLYLQVFARYCVVAMVFMVEVNAIV